MDNEQKWKELKDWLIGKVDYMSNKPKTENLNEKEYMCCVVVGKGIQQVLRKMEEIDGVQNYQNVINI